MPKQPSDLPEGQVTPKPEWEKRSRRIFSTEYKLRIIAEADACRPTSKPTSKDRRSVIDNQPRDTYPHND